MLAEILYGRAYETKTGMLHEPDSGAILAQASAPTSVEIGDAARPLQPHHGSTISLSGRRCARGGSRL